MTARIEGKLTHHLLALDTPNFERATQVPFLEKAGNGTLPKSTLQKWLAQDRLYAQAYMHFASRLLSSITLPIKLDPEDINEGLADLLVEALVGIRRELKLFGEVAGRYGLDLNLDGEEGKGVRGYKSLFEECYLEAWQYAKSFLKEGEEGKEEDKDGGALREVFIPNWTSGEFVSFVDRIGGFVDLLWEKETEEGRKEGRERVEGIWRRVLDVEGCFWPVV